MAVANRNVDTVPGAYRPGDLERSVLDRTKLSRHIPKPFELAEGLRRTFESLR
jgi:hypothetical protein